MYRLTWELLRHSCESYFGFYFMNCKATKDINLWVHKQNIHYWSYLVHVKIYWLMRIKGISGLVQERRNSFLHKATKMTLTHQNHAWLALFTCDPSMQKLMSCFISILFMIIFMTTHVRNIHIVHICCHLLELPKKFKVHQIPKLYVSHLVLQLCLPSSLKLS